MSLRLAARRLGLPAASHTQTPFASSPSLPSALVSQRRNKWAVNIFKGWGGGSTNKAKDAGGADQKLGPNLDDPKQRKAYLAEQQAAASSSGNSSADGIFADEIAQANDAADERDSPAAQLGMQAAEQKTLGNTALVVDPDPRSRERWQRKKVIQMVRARGKPLPREKRIAMTERQILHKSEWMATSTKKLVMLARQIAGKPVDEAIQQMAWSKKKFAQEVKYYLEEARDLAVAQRGMGLGKVKGELMREPREIRTKDGKWMKIEDPTRLYVAQSWVGRGEWLGKEIDYKGRGRMGIIKHPKASLTVVLKEEKTRLREHEEREAKKAAEGPWVHHPNRAVYGQRPYYTW